MHSLWSPKAQVYVSGRKRLWAHRKSWHSYWCTQLKICFYCVFWEVTLLRCVAFSLCRMLAVERSFQVWKAETSSISMWHGQHFRGRIQLDRNRGHKDTCPRNSYDSLVNNSGKRTSSILQLIVGDSTDSWWNIIGFYQGWAERWFWTKHLPEKLSEGFL